MMLVVEGHDHFCTLKKFIINGVNGDICDFGEHYDRHPEDGDEYGCGDMKFMPIKPTKEVLNKYNIDVDEYDEISDVLADMLSFGRCGFCI